MQLIKQHLTKQHLTKQPLTKLGLDCCKLIKSKFNTKKTPQHKKLQGYINLNYK